MLVFFHIKQNLSIAKEGYPVKLTPWIEKVNTLNDFSFTFLNIVKSFNPLEIDWDYDEYGKLWTLNLNYFDFLLQPKISSDTGEFLITDFINKLNRGTIALDPYPISLRGINWIKFISKFEIRNSTIDNSLFAQYKILIKNIEYHLFGNHLLENGFALLFGAFYYNEKNIYCKAKKIIEEQLSEQILTDGGHFELSPMYHQIILDRLLDSINLIQNNQRFDNQDEFLVYLEEKVSTMLSWLKQMTFTNGEIPLVNDSTSGIAPCTAQLVDYVKRLNSKLSTPNSMLSESGYRRYVGNNYECIVDVGSVGPNYIPGHAHADMLSFVLYIDNKPVIIDPGISTYEKNNQRQLERSTCSHNTAIIGGKNQSDVWGGFRVGKRAKISVAQDKASIIEAEHNGYKPVIHKRLFEFIQSGVLISDVLSKPMDKTYAFFHFHPDRKVGVYGNTILIDDKYSLVFKAMTDINLEVYNCPQGYNKYSKAKRCKVTFQSTMQTQINTYEN